MLACTLPGDLYCDFVIVVNKAGDIASLFKAFSFFRLVGIDAPCFPVSFVVSH